MSVLPICLLADGRAVFVGSFVCDRAFCWLKARVSVAPAAVTRAGSFNQADALELPDLFCMLVAQVHVAVVHCHVVLASFTQDMPAQSYTASDVSWVPVSLYLSLLPGWARRVFCCFRLGC